MPRHYRPHLPGHVFHITSLTQGAVDWLEPLKSRIAIIIQEGVYSTGAQLYSYAVMPNHIHIVLVQGTAPLGWTMQPILRRIALLVQKRHGTKGHVFGQPYFSKVCKDSYQLRNTIRYVHRNPVDAGMCSRPVDYEWSSARAWAGLVPCGYVAVDEGLRSYLCSPDGSIDELRAIYLEDCDATSLDGAALRSNSPDNGQRSELPVMVAWGVHGVDKPRLPDIHDVVTRLLRSIAHDMDPHVVRSRCGGPRIVEVRHQLIATLIQRGYTGVAISKYLRISTTAVSKIRSQMRLSVLRASGDNER